MNKKNFMNKETGFTLVEVLVVIIIVAILAAISVPLYMMYVEDARASEARSAISAIWTGAKIHHQRTGEWEKDWKKFKVDIGEATADSWDFRIMGTNPPKQIIATSTSKMSGGAGKKVVFDIEKGEFSGYGSD